MMWDINEYLEKEIFFLGCKVFFIINRHETCFKTKLKWFFFNIELVESKLNLSNQADFILSNIVYNLTKYLVKLSFRY
jgi:hypothetical protein